MAREGNRYRCDHCKKFISNSHDPVTLPEEVDNYGKYCLCSKCANHYSIDYWKDWERKQRTRKRDIFKEEM